MANPRKTATSAKQWRKRTGGVELTLPSGNVCKVVRPGMDKLLKAGIMPDSLTPIAMKNIQQSEAGGRAPKDEDIDAELMETMLKDPDAVGDIFVAFDRVIAMCVKEPKVELHTREVLDDNGQRVLDHRGKPQVEDIPEDERDEELLYTDEVDQTDKTFIFNYVVGGSSDLEQFRDKYGSELEALESQ